MNDKVDTNISKDNDSLWKKGFDLAEAAKNYEDSGKRFELYRQAIKYYDYVLANSPNHLKSLNGKGAAYANTGNYRDAIFFYELVLKINPTFEKTVFNMGFAYLNLEKYDVAISWFKKILKINKAYSRANFNLGNCYFYTGQHMQAMKHYLKELHIDPLCIKSTSNIITCLVKLGRKDLAQELLENKSKLKNTKLFIINKRYSRYAAYPAHNYANRYPGFTKTRH